jgi:hypothetical protein
MSRGHRLPPTRSIRYHVLVLDDADRTVDAVRRLRRDGFELHDVYTPFAVHELDVEMGLRPTRLPWITLLGAALGTMLGLGFQAWTATVDWPLNIGGKTDLALPALMPVTFESAVLLAALFSVGTLLAASRLWPRGRSLSQPIARVTDDRFAIVVREGNAAFDPKRLAGLAGELGADPFIESWKVE